MNTDVEAKAPLTDPGLENRKEAPYEDCKVSAFSARVWPHPPTGGLNGDAVIELKPGTEPKKLRPIQLAGARREAFMSLTKDWLQDK